MLRLDLERYKEYKAKNNLDKIVLKTAEMKR